MLHPKISEMPSLGTSKTNAYFSETLNKIQKMPVRKAESPISVIALNKVNTIYDAIRKECQLKLTYGVYSDMYGRIKLVEDNVGERIVNPYAMIWSNGQQYLIATDADDEKNRIFHFRIDRIYKIELNLKTKKYANGTVNSIPRPVPRDKCPEKLKPFFKKGEFQDGKYRNTFPQMSFSDDNASVDVLINCRKRCLAVLVDNFSQDDSYFIAGETIQANNRNLNLPHPNDEGYTIRIKNVDYNAIKRLCLQMQDDIYVIEPAKLRNDIIKELKAKLDIYEKL
jgi:predicted DNA-binding transcriptional regulator YafY